MLSAELLGGDLTDDIICDVGMPVIHRYAVMPNAWQCNALFFDAGCVYPLCMSFMTHMLHHAKHAVLCCAVLCCAVLCCAVLCCAVLCGVMHACTVKFKMCRGGSMHERLAHKLGNAKHAMLWHAALCSVMHMPRCVVTSVRDVS